MPASEQMVQSPADRYRANIARRERARGLVDSPVVRNFPRRGTKRQRADPEWRRQTFRTRTARVYGLSPEQFDAMVVEQEGRCALCQLPEPSLLVDHCHATSVVRGLLCQACNHLLGMSHDDVGTLLSAIDYLGRTLNKPRVKVPSS